jgi:hypothetical protein
MARSKHYYIRKTHRYLGVILGIQFLFWTIGGLYFSWTDINEIHGDFQRKHPPHLSAAISLVSPALALQGLPSKADSIHSIQLISIFNRPFYNISYFSGKTAKWLLADATTGQVRSPLSKEEAIRMASESFNGKPAIKRVEYLTSTHGHHEYRAKPLPAWAVTFDHPTNTTVYISAQQGRVESFRTNKWRIFDFLWMGHTMDYQGRDNINNWLLRLFSVFGLVTILSGFALYFVSSRSIRRVKRKM